MNIARKLLISLMVSSSVSTSSFAMTVDTFTLTSAEWLTDEQPSSSRTPPKPQKEDLLVVTAGAPFRNATNPKALNAAFEKLRDNDVRVNLITSTGFFNKQRPNELTDRGFTFETWKKLPLEENTVFKGREAEDDVYTVNTDGILYNTTVNPNHFCRSDVPPHNEMNQPRKFIAVMGILEKLKQEKNLPRALYFIEGHPREIKWALQVLQDPQYKDILEDLPVQIYLIQMDEKEKEEEYQKKMHNEYLSEIKELDAKNKIYLESLNNKL